MIFLFSSIFRHTLFVALLSLSLLAVNTNKLLAEQDIAKSKSVLQRTLNDKRSNNQNNKEMKNADAKKSINAKSSKFVSKNIAKSSQKQAVKKHSNSNVKNNGKGKVYNDIKISNNQKNKNNSSLKTSAIAKTNPVKQKQQNWQNISKQKDKISELIDGIESGAVKIIYRQDNLQNNSDNDTDNSCVEEHYAGMVGDKSKSKGMNLDLFLEAKNKSDFILVISGKNVNDEKQVKTMLSGDAKRFAIDILFDKNINDKGKFDDVFSLKENMVNFTYQMPKNVRLKYGRQNYGYTIALYFENDVRVVYQKRSKDEIAIKFSIIKQEDDKNRHNYKSSTNKDSAAKKQTFVIQDYTANSSASDKIFINHEKPIIIAIDAGHGGIDSGAVGANNVLEKNITLKYAQKLKDVLNKNGFKVVMIRDGDKTIPLGRRVKIAKDANADVYISLHTDAHENKKTHGTTIYSLSKLDTGHPDWKKFHNKTYLPSNYLKCMDNFNVLDILIDMTHKYLLEKSQVLTDNILARFKAKNICKRCRHGQRSFAVLRGLDMVSILIEIGYITNDEELKKMQNDEYMNDFINNLGFVIKNTFINKL